MNKIKNIFPIITSLTILFACSEGPRREKFPGPQGQTTDASRAQSTREVMSGTDSFSEKMEQKANAGRVLGGQILLGADKKLPAKYFLFIYAKRLTGGPPLAAKREKAPTLPYSFNITQSNVMIPGTLLEGLVEVSARIDQDGDPISRSEGDLAGTIQAKVGQRDLVITLE